MSSMLILIDCLNYVASYDEWFFTLLASKKNCKCNKSLMQQKEHS